MRHAEEQQKQLRIGKFIERKKTIFDIPIQLFLFECRYLEYFTLFLSFELNQLNQVFESHEFAFFTYTFFPLLFPHQKAMIVVRTMATSNIPRNRV